MLFYFPSMRIPFEAGEKKNMASVAVSSKDPGQWDWQGKERQFRTIYMRSLGRCNRAATAAVCWKESCFDDHIGEQSKLL